MKSVLRVALTAGIVWALSLSVGPAFAAAARTYDSQMTFFTKPEAVTIGARDQVWVSDTANGSLLSQYDAYPSQSKIGQQSGSGSWGGLTAVRGPAVSAVNGFQYAATATCGETNRAFNLFKASGKLYRRIVELEGFPCEAWAAVDNSQSDSRGRVYLYLGQNPSYVLVYDGYGNVVKFTGTAGYIKGNRLTGTPNGNFGASAAGSFEPVYSGITVDSSGNLWVTDQEKREVDEFGPDGIFIQRITGAGAPTPKGLSFGAFQGLAGVAVDPTNGNVLVADRGNDVVDEFSPTGTYIGQLTGAGTPAGGFEDPIGVAVNSQGYVYVTDGPNKVVDIFSPQPAEPTIAYKPETNPTPTSGTLNATVNPNSGGNITTCHFDYGPTASYGSSKPCTPDPSGGNFTVPTDVHVDLLGLPTEVTTHYRVVVGNANATRVGADQTYKPHNVIGLRADPASSVSATSALLNGSFVGNGANTHYYFEWGKKTVYGKTTHVPPGASAGAPTGPGRTSVSFELTGLSPVTRYHYRIVAENGSVSKSEDQTFRTQPFLPEVKQSVSDVHSNAVQMNVRVNPGGADTAYDVEYGTEDCSIVPDPCTIVSPDEVHVGSNFSFASDSKPLGGLTAGTTYHYRVIATNSAGSTYGPDRTFSTYPFKKSLSDGCSNSLARQQTGASLMSDCRAYELVSAAHGGGYDVESNLVAGQTPFGGYPLAESPPRVLYGVHNGAIPGVPGNPTNRGVDPYVATRGSDGWTTSYVGIPADNPDAAAPFSSTLAEADPRLETFAFGGPEICSPCFPDKSSGMPLHLPDGSLVQGMLGSNPQPTAKADGLVDKHLSDDSTHFVFSSTAQFEPDGNNGTGDVSIYDRNFTTGTTQVVSKDPLGNNLTCLQGAGTCHSPGNGAGIAELDISGDGSRIVVGQLVSTVAGNRYYHLYMHVGGDPHTVDLTPGTTSGVLYDGMTSDGTKVFYTTTDKLLLPDTDTSADIYEAEVGGVGPITPKLISVAAGGPSNDNTCNPPGFPNNWNAASGSGRCNAVAVGGGAGVAGEGGDFYFMSPELLDAGAEADGEEDQPNLYVVEPGAKPRFVATVDSSTGKAPPPPPNHPLANGSFLAGLEGAESLAVDQSNGDLYVAERETGTVLRYTSAGAPHPFSEGPAPGTNKLTGQSLGFGGEGEIAVDNAPGSLLAGDLYVTTNGGAVNVFSSTGKQLGELTGFGEACGVAVDQSNGAVYVGDYGTPGIWRLEPTSGSTPVSNANYAKTGITTEGLSPCPVGTDASGHVFAIGYGGGPVKEYSDSDFAPGAPELPGEDLNVSPVSRIYSDPATDDLYVDTGEKIVELNAAREVIGEFGMGKLAGSQGVAINATSKHVYVSNGEKVLEFGIENLPYEPIDNPLVVDSARDANATHTGDFQTTSSGAYAAFPSGHQQDDSYDNAGFTEVYRYDPATRSLRCASCAPTNAPAAGDASLAADGLSLTDDGRVFFDSKDALVLRDDNERKDVYEWELEGSGNCDSSNPNLFASGVCVSLISTGASPFDSSLLSASANGTDAYFFTHDTLTHDDENGPVAKIYDARANGGVFRIPPPALCAASDECHGPGTEAPPAPNVRTKAGSPGNTNGGTSKCRKGFVKKHGKCVKKKHKKRKNNKGRSHR